MSGKWRVRKVRTYVDGQVHMFGNWWVLSPDNAWAQTFPSHAEALEWATSMVARVEYWLAQR